MSDYMATVVQSGKGGGSYEQTVYVSVGVHVHKHTYTPVLKDA